MKEFQPRNHELSDAHREVLRRYRALVSLGKSPSTLWRKFVFNALAFLGGQSDCEVKPLSQYDHHAYGPLLGVSDEGAAARTIRLAAFATPKARALGKKMSPFTIGVAFDAERLGSIGETPVGVSEFAQIWSECIDRTLITTNVGSRANLRFYRRAPIVTIPAGDTNEALETSKRSLAAAFKPFLEAPDGPRPLICFVGFASGLERSSDEKRQILSSLEQFVQTGSIADPKIHRIGLNIQIASGAQGRDSAVAAIDLAHSAGMGNVSVDGVVRKEADEVISRPGLLNYLSPEHLTEIFKRAQIMGIEVRPINEVDSDAVAREIWGSLNTARAMGLNLGKYGLFPLTLEECDVVVGHIQRWFPDWCAAPVFYVDQGIATRNRVYVGEDIADGIEAWLRTIAKHKVRVVLIDTVEKPKGWKILKTNGDAKGILLAQQIADLNELGQTLGIQMLWAGGITLEQAYEFGKLGVFGVYVTSAVSENGPVTGEYERDPGLFAQKNPTFEGILKVKTLLEAGYLVDRLATGSLLNSETQRDLRLELEHAGLDTNALARILPVAWRSWWN